MALTVTQYITLRAPQYGSDARLNDYIDLATMLTSACFGERRNYAIALRVLHYLTLETMRNAFNVVSQSSSGSAIAGIVTGETEGDLSRSYSSGGNDSSGTGAVSERYGDLTKTEYGQELIELINNSMVFARTRMMPTC